MKQDNKRPKGKQQPNHTPAQPKSVTKLTEKDLEQVQGGQSLTSRDVSYDKGVPGTERE